MKVYTIKLIFEVPSEVNCETVFDKIILNKNVLRKGDYREKFRGNKYIFLTNAMGLIFLNLVLVLIIIMLVHMKSKA